MVLRSSVRILLVLAARLRRWVTKQIHTFTNGGTLACTGNGNVDCLVVGGGGSGGGGQPSGGGGGGAGGLVTGSQFLLAGSYPVVVGTGGVGGTSITSNCGTSTGGTVSVVGSRRVHRFAGSGTFTPSGACTVTYTIVGGGGTGGANPGTPQPNNQGGGGGGGGGGVVSGTFAAVSGAARAITVGGAGAASSIAGVNTAAAGATGQNGINIGPTIARGGAGGPSGNGNPGGSNNNLVSGGGGGGAGAGGGGAASGAVGGTGGAGAAQACGTGAVYGGGGGGGSATGGPGSNGGGAGGSAGGGPAAGTAGAVNTGGGGGGGGDFTGAAQGGGAGGSGIVVLCYPNSTVSEIAGNSGTNSTIFGLTAVGGGGGGAAAVGQDGGSGGGGSRSGSTTEVGGSGLAGQGNGGGAGINTNAAGGGGGGCGAIGIASSAVSVGGNAGNGCANTITGTSVTYAGGGGGWGTTSAGTGGTGGGGAGCNTTSCRGAAATANLGGGGGGGSTGGGAGGSGVVIVSYPLPGNLPVRAQTVVNDEGLILHTTGLPYSQLLSNLAYTGVTNLRTEWYSTMISQWGAFAQAGYKLDMLMIESELANCSVNASTQIATYMASADAFIAAFPGSILSFEGVNEINNFKPCWQEVATASGSAGSTATFAGGQLPTALSNIVSSGFAQGVTVTDRTTPANIPTNTVMLSMTPTSVTFSNPVTVAASDVLLFKTNGSYPKTGNVLTASGTTVNFAAGQIPLLGSRLGRERR